jgi:hypothetical protein
MDKVNKTAGVVTLISGIIGCISGLACLGGMVWYGGALAEKVKSIGERVAYLEMMGSNTMQVHVKEDAQRDLNLEARVKRIEDVLLAIPERQARIEAKIDQALERQTRMEDKLDSKK